MLPFRSSHSIHWGSLVWLLSVALCVLISAPYAAGQSKGHKKKGRAAAATPTASPGEQSLTNIPLPIGHEAKGLVFPDFDAEGHLRGRFEAGTAHRIDQEHIGFQQLKITTYTPDNQPDLQVDMHTSVLDLKTRILRSQERTTIQRADFNIVGDSVQFDTNTKTGRLIGNVKMVISSKSHLTAKPDEKE
jgi:lipopolysaccharide assembly outer membrane protein LptD (OstA)